MSDENHGCRCVCHSFPDHGKLQDALEALRWHQEKLASLPASASPQAKGEDWQLIETAPKDGRQLLVSGRDWAAMGSWQGDRWWTHAAWIGARPLFDGKRSVPPTHWMPLPQPPSARPASLDPK